MEGNNVRSFENLCKIFEMRIKLDREKKDLRHLVMYLLTNENMQRK